MAQRGGALLLGQNNLRKAGGGAGRAGIVARGLRSLADARGQRNRIEDDRHVAAARLLRRLMHDAPPARGALQGGLGQMLFRAPRNHRRYRGNAQLGSFLDGPLHVIELVDGHHQRDGHRRIGLQFGDQIEADLIGGDRGHLRMKDVAAGHHVGLHARLRAQHAGHVFSLRAHQGCGGFVPTLGNPAAACHGPLPVWLACTV